MISTKNAYPLHEWRLPKLAHVTTDRL